MRFRRALLLAIVALALLAAPLAAEAPVGSKTPLTTDNEPLQPNRFTGG